MAVPKGSKLFAVYAAASLVPIVVLGIVLHNLVQREFDQRALNEAFRRAQTLADVSVEPALAGHDLADGITDAERAQLVSAMSTFRSGAEVLRLRLRASEGDIVFDMDNPTAPTVFDRDDEVQEAAAGEPVKTLTRLNADVVDQPSTAGERAVEVYVAIHNRAGERIGVLEMYLRYEPFRAAAVASRRHVTLALTIGLLGLWLVLAVISWSVTRRLRRSAAHNDWLVHHDRLTGLPNRLTFSRQLAGAWERHRAVVVVILDIARFGEVNDALGHANGDAMLQSVAANLRRGLGSSRSVARFGGDQFGVFESGDRVDADELVEQVRAAATREIDLGSLRVSPEMVIGVASRDDGVADAAALLEAGELALHAAKEARVDAMRFAPALDHFDPERVALAGELRRAITNDELFLVYQPKIDLKTGTMNGVEALVRWQHPRRGVLLPCEFIPIAESTTIIHLLTNWVLDRALQQLRDWTGPGAPESIALNVSATDLRDATLPDRVLRALVEYGIPAGRLQIEMTETAVVADPVRANAILRRLHDAGVTIAMDDFGQGATSLTSLAQLTLDEIKIDRAFIAAMARDETNSTIVQWVIDIGHRLGLKLVAEGIETPEAAQRLSAMGCNSGQGYYYAYPMTAPELDAWLAQRGCPPATGAPDLAQPDLARG